MATVPDQASTGSGEDTDFGANDWLLEEMYEQFTADPSSVDESWVTYFKAHGAPGAGASGGAEAGDAANQGRGAGNGQGNGKGAPARSGEAKKPVAAQSQVSKPAASSGTWLNG